jgi:hypothetical protein
LKAQHSTPANTKSGGFFMIDTPTCAASDEAHLLKNGNSNHGQRSSAKWRLRPRRTNENDSFSKVLPKCQGQRARADREINWDGKCYRSLVGKPVLPVLLKQALDKAER